MAEFDYRKGEDAILLQPLFVTGRKFYFTVTLLGALVMLGIYAYTVQWREGLGVTGMNFPVSWGFYITNFVFFIGISHAGTLISAILRLSQAEWRRPITRVAEVITVLVLGIEPDDKPQPFAFKKHYPVLKRVGLPVHPYDIPPGTPQQERWDKIRAADTDE